MSPHPLRSALRRPLLAFLFLTLPLLTHAAGAGPFLQRTGAANPLNGLAATIDGAGSFVVGDFRGVGLKDFVGRVPADNALVYWRNNGDGTWTQLTGAANPFNAITFGPSANAFLGVNVAVLDVDGDGDLDIYNNALNQFWRNDGGTFSVQTGANNPLDGFGATVAGAISFVAGDFDGDGFTDLVGRAPTNNAIVFWHNNGNGTWTQRTGAANPFNGISFPAVAGNFVSTNVVVADIDGDGDLDLYNNALNQFWRNDGATFTVVTGAANPLNGFGPTVDGANSFVAGDFDRDGIVDLVGRVPADNALAFWHNDGAGTWTHVTGAGDPFNAVTFPALTANFIATNVAVLDVDGDTDIDLINNGLTEFWEGAQPAPVLVATTPADDATGVPITTDLVLTFDQPVVPGTGNVTLVKTSDSSIAAQIDVTTAAVTGSGTTWTVHWGATLELNEPYHVLADAGTFLNGDAQPFAGIANATTLNFHTVVPPAAVVTNVTSPTADGFYGTGATIAVTVTFDAPVAVTGVPQLQLNSGAAAFANYASGSGTATLTFTYTVAFGENSADLDYATTTALALNGGTIVGPGHIDADRTLPAPGAAGSLGANKAIVVDTLAPTITSALTASGTYGSPLAPYTITASEPAAFSASGLPPWLSLSGATLSGTPTQVGTFPITLIATDLAGNVGAATLNLTIGPATLLVTADPKSRAYGAANPSFTATLTGFQLGDNAGVVSGAPSFATGATTASPVGTYAITPALGTLSATNYSFAFAPGVLTVTPVSLTVTANPASRAYGAANPAFTATLTGFVNGENLATSGVTGAPSFTTSATAASPVGGAYTVTPAAGTLTAANYTFGPFVSGVLTITKAGLTVKADDAARVFGAANPAFTATISGFVNGENLATSGVTGAPTFATPATPASPIGTYPITPSLGTLAAANYAFTSFLDGTLAVTSNIATVTLSGLAQRYDGTPKAVTATTVPPGLAVDITYNGSPTAPTLPGSYAVVATVNDPNYVGTASGTLVIGLTALVRHAPTLNGDIDGSLQVLLPESVTLNGQSMISGDLLVPGTPAVHLNGQPVIAGIQDGAGSATPTNHSVTLNGQALVRYIVRRTDAIPLPVVPAPQSPAGTRNVTLNGAGDSPGDFATLRNLTLNGNAGARAIPAGAYGAFAANGNGGFVLGTVGATTPDVYQFQQLTLNGNATLQVVGPVIVRVGQGVNLNALVGSAAHPEWLALEVASGGVTLNGGAHLHGTVTAPNGTVTINGNSSLHGSLSADRLTLNGNALLAEAP